MKENNQVVVLFIVWKKWGLPSWKIVNSILVENTIGIPEKIQA
jgi:hypothetical protein